MRMRKKKNLVPRMERCAACLVQEPYEMPGTWREKLMPEARELRVDIDHAVAVEEKLFGSCFETQDQKNAMTAFVEKRKHDPFVNC